MDKNELENLAHTLRKELVELAHTYHPRSDQHMNLLMEADAVSSQAQHALGNANPGVLLQPCTAASESHPVPEDLLLRLTGFYEACQTRLEGKDYEPV